MVAQVTVEAAPASKPAQAQPHVPPLAKSGGHHKSRCDLCSRLGVGGDRHDRAQCYIDPKGPEYREHVRRRRLQEVINQGRTIPKDILEMAPFTPQPPRAAPATTNLCQDIMDHVLMNYDVSEAEKASIEALLLPNQPCFHL